MKKNEKKKKYAILILLVFIAFLIVMAEHYYQASKIKGVVLSVEKVFDIPIKELSGLALEKVSDSHHFKVYGVGDQDPEIVHAQFSGSHFSSIEVTDFGDTILERFQICDKSESKYCKRATKHLIDQWEGIQIDPEGRFYLLQEHTSTIFVFNNDFSNIERLINLSFYPHLKKLMKRGYRNDDNSLAEGFVLLNNGHILVVKESGPTGIIEFAPTNTASQGFTPQLLSSGFVFQSSDTHLSYVPIAFWAVQFSQPGCDLSEIFHDQKNLYVLSQKCRMIGEFSKLIVDEKIEFNKVYRLPERIKKPEGAIKLPGNRFLVADDLKSEKKNIYLLEENL